MTTDVAGDPVDNLVEFIAAGLHPHYFSGDKLIAIREQERFKDRAASVIRGFVKSACDKAVANYERQIDHELDQQHDEEAP